MKSRISIEIDFNNGNLPVIQILSQDSDDVRDNLIKSFLQSLQHTSRWCTIQYLGDASLGILEEGKRTRWQIVPVTPIQVKEEIRLMQLVQEEIERPIDPASN